MREVSNGISIWNLKVKFERMIERTYFFLFFTKHLFNISNRANTECVYDVRLWEIDNVNDKQSSTETD